jgi:hypothetical protein
MYLIVMSVVFRDLKGIPSSFSQMVDWISPNTNEKSNAENFNAEIFNADEVWASPTFKDIIDGSSLTIIENTLTTANDGLSLGLYGTGQWDSNFNGYTVGTADSISFTPTAEWAFEIQETDADGKVNTVVVLPNQKYELKKEGATVSLLRVQTPSIKASDGTTELGVMSVNLANGTSAVGDNVAKRGCTDDKGTNHSVDHLIDDGSCLFAEWYEEIPTWGWVVGGVAVVGMVMGLKG